MAYFWLFQFFIFFIVVNIFLAILNDAYIAVQEVFADIEEEEIETVTLRERVRRMKAAFRQKQMERRIEQLRAVARKKEMVERREARRKEDAKLRTLKASAAPAPASAAAPFAQLRPLAQVRPCPTPHPQSMGMAQGKKKKGAPAGASGAPADERQGAEPIGAELGFLH